MGKKDMDLQLYKVAERVGLALQAAEKRLATAESCTGGWVVKCLTDIPGSSAWVERSFITYSNVAKQEMLGVAPEMLETEGAVSEGVVAQMALGALDRSSADIAVALSGIAGPDGGSPAKPVGTVWLSWCLRGAAPHCELQLFGGDREGVRRSAVICALEGVLSRL